MITDAGKNIIRQSLSGFGSAPVAAIAIGIGKTAPSAADAALEYEIGRAPVVVSSIDTVAGAVLYKAVIPAEYSGTIYELGTWSEYTDTEDAEPLLLTFEPGIELWTDGAYSQGNSRIGDYGLKLSGARTADLYDLSIDLSAMLAADTISVALNASAAGGTLQILLMTDDANYLSYTITPVSGYQISRFAIGAMQQTGTPDLENITTARLITTGATDITLDGLKITRSNSRATLVSRSVLATPLIKQADIDMEIEYKVNVA